MFSLLTHGLRSLLTYCIELKQKMAQVIKNFPNQQEISDKTIVLAVNSYFYDSIFLVFENYVRFFYSAEWETMGDKWGSVYLSLLYKMKHFFAVASVYTAGLEG